MTTDGQPQESMSISQSVWVRFASQAGGRCLASGSEPTSDMQRFATYIRDMRYLANHQLEALANDLQLPYEQLALLESGLLKPSEVPGPTWVRLMRILEGREQMKLPMAAPESEVVVADQDPDELWAMDEAPVLPWTPASMTGISPMDTTIGIARIKVIGIGGGGTNAVARMYKQPIAGVEYAAVNTDAQHLLHVNLPVKLRMGDRLTRGLGVGGNPELGREAAEESREDLYDMINGTDLVFLACGMGGGTGTGSAPVIAAIARETGALTIAAVTKPFNFEGKRRLLQAEEGIAKLRANVDTLILIPNDRLANVSDERMTAEHAFQIADDVLRQGVESITELITVPGEINLDFADLKTVLSSAGPAWMAIGHGRGENRAIEAARAAMLSPLLDVPVEGATRVLLNITGGDDLMLQEVQSAADFVSNLVDPDANIIFGMVTDSKMDDEVRVTVIATGLPTGDNLLHNSLEEMLQLPSDEAGVDGQEDVAGVELPGFLKRFGFKRRNDA